jgi:hypothetical protein
MQLAEAAVDVLGWRPGNLLELDLLGSRLTVLYRPDDDEICRREREGLGPHADAWILRCRLDLDPGFLVRPAPVELLGAVAVRARWSAACTGVAVFTAFGPRAVVLPRQACSASVLTEAAVLGVGVVAWQEGEVSCLAPAGHQPPFRRSHVHRLGEETVWDHARRPSSNEGRLALAPTGAV